MWLACFAVFVIPTAISAALGLLGILTTEVKEMMPEDREEETMKRAIVPSGVPAMARPLNASVRQPSHREPL